MNDLVEFLHRRLNDDRAAIAGSLAQFNMIEPFDPERLRADIDAKVRIIDLHQPMRIHPDAMDPRQRCAECGDTRGRMRIWPCPTLLAVAQVYADHPDFDPEWKL